MVAPNRVYVVQGNSRVLVDAEHTYFQPAIDALTIRLQQRCNRQEPVIINTYQVTCSKGCLSHTVCQSSVP